MIYYRPGEPIIPRSVLATEILVLRSYLAYYMINFNNLGTPGKRTIQYEIPSLYKKGRTPIYESTKLRIGNIDVTECVHEVIKPQIEHLIGCYITLDDLYNDILKVELKINGLISENEYERLWTVHVMCHSNMVMIGKKIDKIVTTEDMSENLSQYLKILACIAPPGFGG